MECNTDTIHDIFDIIEMECNIIENIEKNKLNQNYYNDDDFIYEFF